MYLKMKSLILILALATIIAAQINSCPEEHDLIESFNKVSTQLSVRGSNGELCHIEEEGEHHDEEHHEEEEGHHEEEEGHHEEEHHEGDDDHNMTNTTASCSVMYDLCKNVIITLNLTTNECLEAHGHGNVTSGISSAQAYGYGFLMIVLVSLCSLLGVLLVPFISSNSVIGKQTYEYVYALMIAVGISALVSDAILHLIPHAFGLHAHEEGDGHDHSSEEEGTPDYIWKGCLILLGIYSFYLLEIVIHGIGDYLSKRSKTTSHKHSFSNGCSTDDGNYSSELPTVKSDQSPENIELSAEKPSSSPNETGANGHVENNDKAEVEVKKPFYLRIEPVAWLIIFGDAFHNFADGLALGGAIAQSLTLGVSTMFALIFHELPHELGDYVILIKSGMHWAVALLFNFLSALTAILGFFIGVAISTQFAAANGWILSFTAGLFLYIALTDLLPELIHGGSYVKLNKGGWRWALRFFLSNLGFFISFALLLVLAVYEEKLNELIK